MRPHTLLYLHGAHCTLSQHEAAAWVQGTVKELRAEVHWHQQQYIQQWPGQGRPLPAGTPAAPQPGTARPAQQPASQRGSAPGNCRLPGSCLRLRCLRLAHWSQSLVPGLGCCKPQACSSLAVCRGPAPGAEPELRVRLMAAYQDEKDLMLLQEWVGGDPLPSVSESRDLHAWFKSMGST